MPENIITHSEKVLWPHKNITKGMLGDYYSKVAKYILPYLRNRPLTLHRFPNGFEDSGFYQKNIEDKLPGYMITKKIHADSTGESVRYCICNNEESMLYLINMNCIDFNPWNSTRHNLHKPTYLILDFDPDDISNFGKVVDVVKSGCEILKKMGVTYRIKTSGALGMHLYIPLDAKYQYDEVRAFAKILAAEIHKMNPATTTMERTLVKRKGKIYLDYLQNSFGQTVASVYSVRPVPDASVSAPLLEKELKTGLEPAQFNIFNMHHRLAKKGDIFHDVLSGRTNIQKCLKKLGF